MATDRDHDPDEILDAVDRHAALEADITAYLAAVDVMPGPLGELLRAIGDAWRGYLEADQDGTVTLAEYHRLAPVLDTALAARRWLQEDT